MAPLLKRSLSDGSVGDEHGVTDNPTLVLEEFSSEQFILIFIHVALLCVFLILIVCVLMVCWISKKRNERSRNNRSKKRPGCHYMIFVIILTGLFVASVYISVHVHFKYEADCRMVVKNGFPAVISDGLRATCQWRTTGTQWFYSCSETRIRIWSAASPDKGEWTLQLDGGCAALRVSTKKDAAVVNIRGEALILSELTAETLNRTGSASNFSSTDSSCWASTVCRGDSSVNGCPLNSSTDVYATFSREQLSGLCFDVDMANVHQYELCTFISGSFRTPDTPPQYKMSHKMVELTSEQNVTASISCSRDAIGNGAVGPLDYLEFSRP